MYYAEDQEFEIISPYNNQFINKVDMQEIGLEIKNEDEQKMA